MVIIAALLVGILAATGVWIWLNERKATRRGRIGKRPYPRQTTQDVVAPFVRRRR